VLDVVTPASLTAAEFQARLGPVLAQTDVFLPNDHEAKLISGVEGPLAQAEYFHARGAETVIVTQGERGSVLVSKSLRLRAGAYAMPLVDGTGGGDAFAAGYIAGLLRGLDPEGCLRMASAVGASCVRTIGTTTGVFTRAECEDFLAGNELRVEAV
jgi:sugar/nucleoside kinase (ribokinase family)